MSFKAHVTGIASIETGGNKGVYVTIDGGLLRAMAQHGDQILILVGGLPLFGSGLPLVNLSAITCSISSPYTELIKGSNYGDMSSAMDNDPIYCVVKDSRFSATDPCPSIREWSNAMGGAGSYTQA